MTKSRRQQEKKILSLLLAAHHPPSLGTDRLLELRRSSREEKRGYFRAPAAQTLSPSAIALSVMVMSPTPTLPLLLASLSLGATERPDRQTSGFSGQQDVHDSASGHCAFAHANHPPPKSVCALLLPPMNQPSCQMACLPEHTTGGPVFCSYLSPISSNRRFVRNHTEWSASCLPLLVKIVKAKLLLDHLKRSDLIGFCISDFRFNVVGAPSVLASLFLILFAFLPLLILNAKFWIRSRIGIGIGIGIGFSF